MNDLLKVHIQILNNTCQMKNTKRNNKDHFYIIVIVNN